MRWLRFYAVGAMGAALQFALLGLLVHVAGLNYLLATALSVEAAILHNFLWHRRWTWDDRRGASDRAGAALARFNLTNGLVSISANLLSAYLLTGVWRIDPVLFSIMSVAAGSLANFFLSDRVVFAPLRSNPSPQPLVPITCPLLRNQGGVAEGGVGVEAVRAGAPVSPSVAKPAMLCPGGRHIGVSNAGGYLGLAKAL